MVPIHPQKIDGIWQFGVALDLQTTRSTPMGVNGSGHMQFDTQRPPLAQLLYRLKYQGDAAAAPEIVQTAADWLRQHRSKIDVLIPVPPSQVRALQPVLVLATGIGMALALPVLNCITLTKSPSSLKAVDDPAARH
jgi:predicted amidophosphoribosyltransferase